MNAMTLFYGTIFSVLRHIKDDMVYFLHKLWENGQAVFEVILMNDHKMNSYKSKGKPDQEEAPIPEIYPAIDNDLARDNLENDIPAADLTDLRPDQNSTEG